MIAELPQTEVVHLARTLAKIAGTKIDDVRASVPDSSLSRLHLFMYFLQNNLLGMTPNEYHPERPVSLVGQALRRQTDRMAPVIAEFHKGYKVAQKIKPKPRGTLEKIKELRAEGLTWNEVDQKRGVEPGASRQLVYRSKNPRRR
jgi:hypothetical protein